MKEEVLQLWNLTLRGNHQEKVSNINLLLREAECFVFMGLDDTRQMISDLFKGKGRIDQGKIFIHKKRILSYSRSAFEQQKVFYIDRNTAFMNSLNLSENIFLLKRNGLRKIFLNKKAINIQSEHLFKTYGLNYDLNEKAENLGVMDKIIVSIIRAAGQGARLLVMNDIMTECSLYDSDRLRHLLKKIKEQGIALLISDNHTDRFLEIADCIVVMNRGGIEKKIYNKSQFNLGYEIIMKGMKSMIKEECCREEPAKRDAIIKEQKESDRELDAYKAITLSGSNQFDIPIKQGEVLLIVNSDTMEQKKLWNIMSGEDCCKPRIILNGVNVSYKNNLDLIHNKMAFWGYGRDSNEIFPYLSVKDNILIPSVKKISDRVGMYQPGASYIFKDTLLFESGFTNANSVSGNDVLKVILYRWKLFHPQVFLLCNIISNADAQAKEWLKQELLEMAARGTSIILLEMAIEDVLKLADKTIIINRGMKTELFSKENYNEINWEKYLEYKES